jgi:hypothetical protein
LECQPTERCAAQQDQTKPKRRRPRIRGISVPGACASLARRCASISRSARFGTRHESPPVVSGIAHSDFIRMGARHLSTQDAKFVRALVRRTYFGSEDSPGEFKIHRRNTSHPLDCCFPVGNSCAGEGFNPGNRAGNDGHLTASGSRERISGPKAKGRGDK